MNRSFWAGRRVFVTGHTGFKGAWLCLMLERLGATVAGYALAPPTNPSLYDLADAGARVTSTTADLRDLGRLTEAMRALPARGGAAHGGAVRGAGRLPGPGREL